MNISILCIHMYNIIDGIVVMKFSFFVKEGYKFQSFLEALWSVVLCAVGGVRRQVDNLKEMSFIAVLACVII